MEMVQTYGMFIQLHCFFNAQQLYLNDANSHKFGKTPFPISILSFLFFTHLCHC